MQVLTTVGQPASFRYTHYFAGHAFKFVNSEGEYNWVKFHLISDQGTGYLTTQQAAQIRAMDSDYFIRDLYNAIASNNFPSWTLKIQIMSPKRAEEFPGNPFDLTKIWPEPDFPLRPVGVFIFNRNVLNDFEETEQSAFSPSNLVPGIEMSPDKVLHARSFAYPDTQRHRLGANLAQLPVNRPRGCPLATYFRDGASADINPDFLKPGPNYSPNTFNGPTINPAAAELPFKTPCCNTVDRYDTIDDDNWTQARLFWYEMNNVDRDFMIFNMAYGLSNVAPWVREKFFDQIKNVHQEIVDRIKMTIAKLAPTLNENINFLKNLTFHSIDK